MAIDETCPVCLTAQIVCGKWTLLLVRDLAAGRSRFCELERSLAGISPVSYTHLTLPTIYSV